MLRIKNLKLKIKNYHSGFTLIEALVYLAIAGIILVIIADIFISQSQVYDKETGKIDIDLYAKTALNRMVEQSLSATTVVATRTFGGSNFESNNQTLILELPSLDNNQDIIANTYDYLVIYRDLGMPNKLYLQIDATTGTLRTDKTTLLANFVTNLNFRYNMSAITAANKIDVTLTLEKTVRGLLQKSENTTSLFLKNKL